MANLRDTLEHFAGYHIRPQTGTVSLMFGACAAEAHGRCPSTVQAGPTTAICECPCHEERAEQFDNLYGPAWYADGPASERW